jgi:hypothetical protein
MQASRFRVFLNTLSGRARVVDRGLIEGWHHEMGRSMKPQLFALIAVMVWEIGGYFEKNGLHPGHLSPQVDITIRAAVALVVLSAAGASRWRNILPAEPKALVSLVVGAEWLQGRWGCFASMPPSTAHPWDR